MDHALSHITTLISAGVPFERIEAWVEAQQRLDDEQRAVLWLFAWAGAAPSVVASELGRPSGRTF